MLNSSAVRALLVFLALVLTGCGQVGGAQVDDGAGHAIVVTGDGAADMAMENTVQCALIATRTSEVDANSGVRSGDRFELFRQINQPQSQYRGSSTNAFNSYYQGLEDTDARLTVTQTFPGYSVVKASTTLRASSRYLGMSW